MKTLKEHVRNLISHGKYFFEKQDVLRELNLSVNQFRFQAYRLSQKKIIKKLTNEFYMIIAPEYYQSGSLPTHWIIDSLMKHLNQDYYIGLLTAASMHGATEQQPMIFQVITDITTKDIILERTTIEFHISKYCSSAQKTTLKAPTGFVKISTTEQTMCDLVRFYKVCGFLSNVSLVIKNLAEECDPQKFIYAIQHEKTKSVLQRLGYILEYNQFSELAKLVEDELSQREAEYVLLRPDFHEKTGIKNERWKLILNDTLEVS